MSVNTNQAIFDAIVAAIHLSEKRSITISVKKFIETFNNHRDRKLCTSLDPLSDNGSSDEDRHGGSTPSGGATRSDSESSELRRAVEKALCCPGGCVRTDDCFVEGPPVRWSRSKREREQADAILALIPSAAQEPSGLANLQAIVADQPFQNSALSVYEINLILENKGGFMPDEAVTWFRASRGTFGSAQEVPEPVAMLGGIHGVTLIRHIEAMLPAARTEYHTPLYKHPAPQPASNAYAPRIEALEVALRAIVDCLGYAANEGKSPAVRESNAHEAWKIARGALPSTD